MTNRPNKTEILDATGRKRLIAFLRVHDADREAPTAAALADHVVCFAVRGARTEAPTGFERLWDSLQPMTYSRPMRSQIGELCAQEALVAHVSAFARHNIASGKTPLHP